ncbi:MAG TPA: glycerophosphodiester phosphodiesterase [Baekduia sp.]|uniref:glycerophosphodiester phosphodiesterase n=1 Tax=Baekduia sp. TaxID=2600305 RepID=UPI002D77B6B8|nr:glycerophosphodiester phosphodiesterase [Baekduia sp.]HET6509359.1 glycerophosphodiester phosphodiesterase [Baekduia sp.]
MTTTVAPGRVKRVGHKGAGQLAPGNTVASFEAALAAGVDVIEFDVLCHRGELLLAHSSLDARRRRCLTLAEGLACLADPRYARVLFNVDLKRPGYEARTVDLLRAAAVLERCLFSSQFARCLDRVKRVEPTARVGISVGGWLSRRRHRWNRRVVPRIEAAIVSGRFDCLMAHHRLVDSDLVARMTASGGEIYAWTVDSQVAIERLLGLGVTGITTNDPRLFRLPAGPG